MTNPARRRRIAGVLFVIAAIAALAAYGLTMELRYVWYLDRNKAAVVHAVLGVSLLSIVVLWAVFPSRVAVAIVALTGLGLPPVYDREAFVSLDWPFALIMAALAALLVGATQLRRLAEAKDR